VVLLAHYTVKEFLCAERTAYSLDTIILKLVLEEDAAVAHWAKTVLDVALAAPPTDNPMSSDSLDDYCQGVAPLIVKTWDKVLPTLGLRGECLQLLNPTGAHHSRRANKRTLFLEWASTPANPTFGALAGCFYGGYWALAREAARLVDAREILGTTLCLITATGVYPSTDYLKWRGRKSEVLLEASLVLSIFLENIERVIQREQLDILAECVSPDALLFAVIGKPENKDLARGNKLSLLEKMLELGADVNSTACQMTPLQLAALLWDFDSATFLISAGADVNKVGSAQGFRVAGTNIDYEGLIDDSPLRILRTAPFTLPWASICVRRVGRGAAAKSRMERLLVEAGARDFRH